MKTIGLIAAMEQESQALRRMMKGWKRVRVGKYRGFQLEISDQTWVLVTSGMGLRRAKEAAQTLVEAVSPQILVSFGIAGAVETTLNIGDVINAEAVCLLDGENLGEQSSLGEWPEASREAMARELPKRGARFIYGTAVTTGGTQYLSDPSQLLPHPILEMETAGIAEVARGYGIPLFSLRAISDGPGAPIPVNLGEMMDEDANLQVGRLLKTLVGHPGLLFRSLPMLRNTRIAEDNAAIAVGAALLNLAD